FLTTPVAFNIKKTSPGTYVYYNQLSHSSVVLYYHTGLLLPHKVTLSYNSSMVLYYYTGMVLYYYTSVVVHYHSSACFARRAAAFSGTPK
ncbi:MAG: hypothetical protein PHU36_08760, partial [Syntrophomonadaceae bacterium]|nr:hypothetical protein [Syntrophomonadaceae bacterium]